MFVYFIPLAVNLTKNSKLENFVHELVGMYVDTLSTLGPHSSPHPSITMCS